MRSYLTNPSNLIILKYKGLFINLLEMEKVRKNKENESKTVKQVTCFFHFLIDKFIIRFD